MFSEHQGLLMGVEGGWGLTHSLPWLSSLDCRGPWHGVRCSTYRIGSLQGICRRQGCKTGSPVLMQPQWPGSHSQTSRELLSLCRWSTPPIVFLVLRSSRHPLLGTPRLHLSLRRTQRIWKGKVSLSLVTNFLLDTIFSHLSPETGNGMVPPLVLRCFSYDQRPQINRTVFIVAWHLNPV